MTKKFIYLALFLILSSWAVATDVRRLEVNTTVDWLNSHEFDVTVGETTRRFDCSNINATSYNDFDRKWLGFFYQDLEGLTGCSDGTIGNITKTVGDLIYQCQNYQNYINGTIQYADKYAEWMAEAARLKSVVANNNEQIKSLTDEGAQKGQQLTGCLTDKQSYMQDWQASDKNLATCTQDLSSAKNSFASKYLIGAVLGGVLIFIFTKKNDKAGEEQQEFEEVDY